MVEEEYSQGAQRRSNGTSKNLIPISIVIAGLIIAGAVVLTGAYTNVNKLPDLEAEDLSPAAVVNPEAAEDAGTNLEPEVLANLAKCLTDKGFKFFGAHWCGWCNKQKELFGDAAGQLPYVECMDANDEMTAECIEAGVQSFPTWQLPDKSSNPGFKEAEQLAELSGCEL